MLRNWLTLLLLTACTALQAQEQVVARIVDARTKQPLPFASVYVNGSNSTISNADGEFLVEAALTDTLRFTYVGYKTLRLCAADVHSTVPMKVDDRTLGEVMVMGTDMIVKKVYEQTKKEYKANKKEQKNFFFRQTTFCDNECYAFLESFFSGRSAVQLRNLALVTGRYVSLANTLTSNPINFYTFTQVPVFSIGGSVSPREQLVPLYTRYYKAYEVKSQAVSDGEQTVYRLDFVPRDTTRWAVKGSLYVDANSFQLLKFEGEGQMDVVKHKYRGIGWIMPIQYSFVVNYIHDNDFTEVGSVYFKTHFTCVDHDFDTTGTLYNVGERYVKGRDKMEFDDNLLWTIRKQGLNNEFWEENEVVKRTPLEEEALELFEHDNLIGVY